MNRCLLSLLSESISLCTSIFFSAATNVTFNIKTKSLNYTLIITFRMKKYCITDENWDT